MKCCTGPPLPGQAEVNDAGQAGHQAVDTERDEAASTEVPDQEPDRRVRAQARQHAAEQDLAADAVAKGPAAAANPLLLPVARAVDYTVERWADERAATVTGDRRLVAATIGRVALLAPPPGRQLALLAVAALLVLIAGVSATEAARDLHALVELAQAAR